MLHEGVRDHEGIALESPGVILCAVLILAPGIK